MHSVRLHETSWRDTMAQGPRPKTRPTGPKLRHIAPRPETHRSETETLACLETVSRPRRLDRDHIPADMYQIVQIFDSHIFRWYIKFRSTSYRFHIISIYRTITRTMFIVVTRLQCTDDDSLKWICKSVRQPKSRDGSIFS